MPRSDAARAPAPVTVDVGMCCYDLVRDCVKGRGWRLLEPSNETARRAQRYHMYWTDRSVTRTRVSCLGEHQMINHFPGMLALTSKSQLATHMRKMQELHPDDYAFMPESWVLPEEHAAFQRECRRNREHSSGAMFIVKPERGCQGRKIFLTNDPDDPAITKAAWYGALGGDTLVAQRYIQNPLVFHSEPSDKGFKFDLRLYVIITSCNPLRVLLYKDGLARFCTEAYSEATADNKDWRFMHLTNFSLNKSNGNFVESLDAADAKAGSKRRLSVLFDYLHAEGHDVPRLWAHLEDMVAKSMLAVLPLLQHYYGLCKPGDKFGDRCIEVLGMDVLLDADLKPWLLEFNHSPSFHVNGCVDEAVKGPLLHDIFDLLAPALEHRAAEYPTARQRSSQALQTGQCITNLAGVHGAGSHGLLKRMRNKVKEHRRERAKAWADREIDANEQAEGQGKGAASNRRQRQSLEEFALDCPRFYPPGADRCKWARRSREEEEAWVEMREQCEAALSARMKRVYPPSCPLLQAKYAQIEASAAALHNIGPSGRRRSEPREERRQGADAASSDSDSEGPGPWDDDVGLSDSSESGRDDALPSRARSLDADGSKGSKMRQPASAPEEEDVAALSGPQHLLVRCAAIMFGLGLLCPPIMFICFMTMRRLRHADYEASIWASFAKWLFIIQLPIVVILLLMYLRMEILLAAVMSGNNSMTVDEFWEKEIRDKAAHGKETPTPTQSYCGAKH